MPQDVIEFVQGVGISVVGTAALFLVLFAARLFGRVIDRVTGRADD